LIWSLPENQVEARGNIKGVGVMPRKIVQSKRKTGRHKPFDYFTLYFEINFLIENPDKIPSNVELITLQEHGVTIEEFRKHYKWFKNAYKKSLEKHEMTFNFIG
jgi:hypothetical protein